MVQYLVNQFLGEIEDMHNEKLMAARLVGCYIDSWGGELGVTMRLGQVFDVLFISVY